MKKLQFRILPILLIVGFITLIGLTSCGNKDISYEEMTDTVTNKDVVNENIVQEEITIEKTEKEDVLINDNTLKLNEEVTKKAEEEALKKAEDEAAKKVEEEKKLAEQMNSFSMMYYLAITAEDIRTSKSNRLILDDIYTSLLNDINPGTIDEITQDHLRNLRDIIKAYIDINTKRERLQFIYNQQKAIAIRSSMPKPLSVLSLTNALDWKKFAMNVVFTAVDSYTNYKNANESSDNTFLMSGWDLDDEELATVQKNRDRAFDYMVDMVQNYELDGKLTLNEKTIKKFVEICAIESIHERIRRLTSEEDTYKLLGSYWLELADCYFENSQYDKCLECVEKYQKLSTGIFRRDYNYAQMIPKALVAAKNIYSENEYITIADEYVQDLLDNLEKSEENWSIRYFAAQIYLDLYQKTKDKQYMESAYNISYDNVLLLLDQQRKLNETYLAEIEELTIEEPKYDYLTKEEKKVIKKQFSEERKQVNEFNKIIKKSRKTELPTIYEPLILNCELLFALAKEMNISNQDKLDIEAILQTSTNGIFLSRIINAAYSFYQPINKYEVSVKRNEIIIPVTMLTAGSKIQLIISNNGKSEIFTDCKIEKVERTENSFESYMAYVSSEQFEEYTWCKDAKLTIIILYSDVYDKDYTLNYIVSEYEPHWYGDKVVFVQE